MGFLQVSVSHEVSPLIKLVGRGDTTVVDAYLSPILRRYVAHVAEELASAPPPSASSPSPRLRGEGRGEGLFPQAQTRGESPSPGAQVRADLSPQAGRGEGSGREQHVLPAGRVCPRDYAYDPAEFAARADFSATALYVVGGLYGNLEAARTVERLAAAERGDVAIVYNGDFHWFDASDYWFDAVEQAVAPHRALRGNVETEIARTADIGAGCGCAYPDSVSDDVVARSNLILSELRIVAARAPAACARLARLPMHLTAEVGGLRVGIVHGDAISLGGWGFTREALAAESSPDALADLQARSRIEVFASTHTCLALLREAPLPGGRFTVINNGAAGMPNFAGTHYGVISRIATTPSPHRPLYGARRDDVHIDALAVAYDHGQFLDRFLARWPAGSPAHLAYARRILEGPAYTIAQALGHAPE